MTIKLQRDEACSAAACRVELMQEESVRRVEVFEFGELVRLASGNADDADAACLRRFMRSLGPAGCGLLAVRGVPSLLPRRAALLPLAQFLALSPPLQRSIILKEHGLGTDVSLKDPCRLVSSFAAQLCFDKDHECMNLISKDDVNIQIGSTNNHINGEPTENAVDRLGFLFKDLGRIMVDVGLLVARICDMAIPGAGLEEAILQACTAKGRLIHYHAVAERLFLESIQGLNACKGKKVDPLNEKLSPSAIEAVSCRDLWQQWHFDYGIFTLLTVPMFICGGKTGLRYADTIISGLPAADEFSPSGSVMNTIEWDALSRHIGLKVLNTGDGYVECVSVPPDCMLVQVGEVAQILTGGKLQATAHCVGRPLERSDVSRETFVVFLQPAWNKQLYWPNPSTCVPDGACNYYEQTNIVPRQGNSFDKDFQEVLSIVPPLESRWTEGFTFAEFSKETTRQYYGANGVQSKR